jgi:hypothetical protein
MENRETLYSGGFLSMIIKPNKNDLDFEDDFGFSAVSEDELKEIERKLHQDLQVKSKQLEQVETNYQDKLEQLYKAIMPLLINLSKSPEKSYLYWPNRVEKVKEFIERIDRIVES